MSAPIFDRKKYPIGPLTMKCLRRVLAMYPDDMPLSVCGEFYAGLNFAASHEPEGLNGLETVQPSTAAAVKWIDNPDMNFATAMLGWVIVGRVFYNGRPTRYFCGMSVNMGASAGLIQKGPAKVEDAKRLVEKAVATWLDDAGLQVRA